VGTLPLRAEEEISLELRVELRKGGLEAVAFLASGPVDLDAAAETAKERLRELGVPNGISQEALLQALSPLSLPEPPADGVILVRGAPPQPGISAQIVPSFPVRDTPPLGDAEAVETYFRNLVYPGDTLLQKTPASPGIPGRSLLGASIPAPNGADVPIVAGDGVTVDDSGCTFRATAYGVVIFHRGQLRVVDALEVSEDRMEARLTVLPDPGCDAGRQVEKIVEALGRCEVLNGVDRDALAAAVTEARTSTKPVRNVIVARGQPPVDGRETDFRLLIDSDKKVGKVLDGDRIDFREVETVKNVHKGEALAEVIPGVEPVAGYRVDGTPLRPKTERATGPKPGENTAPSEDGRQMVADADGMVVLKGNRFHVVDQYLIQGDVDYRTGNIRASGSVDVRGQVKPGFQVRAGQDVQISEDVEEAAVEGGGDVTIRGGVLAGSKIISGGNLSVKYLLNSYAEAELDVEVRLSVTNSQVYAKGKVRVLGSQGAIIGGEINAARGLEARSIGSPSSKTHVAVGVDLRVLREIQAIDRELNEIQGELPNLQANLGKTFLRDPRAAIEALPPALRKPKLDLLMRMKSLYQKNADLTAQRQMLELTTEELRGAAISVQGEVHPGTVLTVGAGSLTITETLRHVVFSYDRDQRRVVSSRL
jgi:uncharacterized protein (DUF342 family)